VGWRGRGDPSWGVAMSTTVHMEVELEGRCNVWLLLRRANSSRRVVAAFKYTWDVGGQALPGGGRCMTCG
jgi:hypothetical protein